jgi:hypothetical protein
MTVYRLINVLAMTAAFASALLWFRAARLRLDAAEFGAYGGATPNSVKQFARQARLNGWAALATGFSAVLQAIGLMLAP